VAPSAHHQRTILGEQPLAAANGMLDQRRGLEIPENFRAGHYALRF
jgi:hypothetical protein